MKTNMHSQSFSFISVQYVHYAEQTIALSLSTSQQIVVACGTEINK